MPRLMRSGALGAGLAILSRWPIVEMETHMYRLTGVPVFVHQGDWIAGKACGRITISHDELRLVDVWTTHVRLPPWADAYPVYRCRRSGRA